MAWIDCLCFVLLFHNGLSIPTNFLVLFDTVSIDRVYFACEVVIVIREVAKLYSNITRFEDGI